MDQNSQWMGREEKEEEEGGKENTKEMKRETDHTQGGGREKNSLWRPQLGAGKVNANLQRIKSWRRDPTTQSDNLKFCFKYSMLDTSQEADM